jgi:hypothetical protein
VLGVADDQAGTGAEDRLSGFVMGPQRRLQSGRLDPLGDRGALAAGDDQAVETVQIPRRANLGDLGAELAQDPAVGLEVALDR